MDVSWLEERVATGDPEVLDHFKRVQDALLAGGISSGAWSRACGRHCWTIWGCFPRFAGRRPIVRSRWDPVSSVSYEEPNLTPEASIAIFRIVQESLTTSEHAGLQRRDRGRTPGTVARAEGSATTASERRSRPTPRPAFARPGCDAPPCHWLWRPAGNCNATGRRHGDLRALAARADQRRRDGDRVLNSRLLRPGALLASRRSDGSRK